ncbi:MAG: NADPH-dependent F420 reductase [Polyangiaceae bacterium]
MKVGILGSGDVGKALGKGFVKHGHEVKIGSRDTSKLDAWVKENGAKASAGSFADAAKFGELVVLATLGNAVESVIGLAGKESFDDKVVIDATNPLKMEPNQLPQLSIAGNDSLGEQVQRWLPKAKVVKAFNTVGNAYMVDPKFEGGPPDMFIGGDYDGAKHTVTEILKSFGWGVVDLGGISASRYLEPMCIVWVHHGIKSGKWNHAFKFLYA